MATYAASTTGNNANSGTVASPKRDPANAVALAGPGDTVYFRGGTYTGSDATIDSQGHTVNSGSSYGSAVTIASYPGETAILQPSSGVSAVRLYTAVSYIIIQDLIIDMSAAPGHPDAVILSLCDHIRFQRIDAKNGSGFGFHSGADTSFIEVLNSQVHGFNYSGSLPGDNHGFYMTGNDALFEGNEVYNCAGYGFHIYNNSGPHTAPSRNICRNNRVHDLGFHGSQEHGIIIGYGDDNTVYNNIVYNCPGGIQVYTSQTNGKVYNNTVYGCPISGISLQYYGGGATIKNNIVRNCGTKIYDFDLNREVTTASPGPHTIANNFTDADPIFVNAGAANFNLQATSPCIDAGATIAAVTTDYLGATRPAGSAYDIGAYEFGGIAMPSAPVVVGPGTNTTSSSATAISTLPYSVTLDTSAEILTMERWWTYTAAAGDLMVGAIGWADPTSNFKASISVYTGTPSALTDYMSLTDTKRPIEVPVTAGTTYYFKVKPSTGSSAPLGVSLTFELRQQPHSAAPLGSILVPDDVIGFPAMILSATTGESLRVIDVPASERGDTIANGSYAQANSAADSDLAIYSPTWTLQTTVSNPVGGSIDSIRSDGNATWYVSNGTAVKAINFAGTVTGSWTLPANGVVIAPNRTGTILYYGASGAANQPVKRYDLSASAALSDLVAGIANYSFGNDFLVLSDGTLLILYRRIGVNFKVLHYDTSGSTLHTYDFGTGQVGRLALAADDPNSFWAWVDNAGTPSTSPQSQFKNIKISDGSTLSTQTSFQFEGGFGPVLAGYSDIADVPRFGHSESCPFVITRTAVSAPVVGDPTHPTIDDTKPCCKCECPPGTSPPGTPASSNGGGDDTVPTGTTGEILDPIDPTTWIASCVGGGTVPTAVDLTDAEDWAA